MADRLYFYEPFADKSMYETAEELARMSSSQDSHLDIRALREYLLSLPKTEIHIHIEAVASTKTYHELNQKYKIAPDLKKPEDFKRYTKVKNLKEMIDAFMAMQAYLQSPDDFRPIVGDIVEYAKSNNIVYLEVFFSPSVPKRNGIEIQDIYSALEEEIRGSKANGGPDIRCIVDVSRGFGPDNSMANLKTLLDYKATKEREPFLLGIGLGGAEKGNHAADYSDVFKLAKAEGLVTVAHAGEEVDSGSIIEALDDLGAQRIGHGTSAVYDDALMDRLRSENIPLEICPTSNVVTRKFVQSLEEHPIRTFFDKGLNVTLNTDDPFFFNINLIDEYVNLAEKLAFTREELFQIIKNGVFATFMNKEEKDVLWNRISEANSL